ncbi:MAG: alpha/beta hydrolase [Dehalococcoidia bacterium]
MRLVADDAGESFGWLYEPAGVRPRTVVALAHPRAEFGRHYAIPGLVRAGYAAFGQNSRYLNNDTEAIHERLLLDVAAGMRWLRDEGFRHVVLAGNSGGGSLYAMYQAQATLPPGEREQETPGGSRIDLSGAMPPGDGFIAIAAHPGEGRFLLNTIDPSVTEEADPLSCDPALDMFNPENGYDPATGAASYSAAFLERYRAAQRARVARLDAIARAQIAREREGTETARVLAKSVGATPASPAQAYARLQADRRAVPHRLMVIYRTVANPAYLDLSIDPNERDLGSIFGLVNARPEFGNYFSSNIARVLSPRAWLSTWSGLSSRADFLASARSLTVPALFVPASGDSDILPSDAGAMWEAIASPDKTRHDIAGADHYLRPTAHRATGAGPREELIEVMAAWLEARFARDR